jgi:hypothetical protein
MHDRVRAMMRRSNLRNALRFSALRITRNEHKKEITNGDRD